MDIKVIDGLFTDKFLLELYTTVNSDISWEYANIANRKQYPLDCVLNEGSHRFFGSRIYDLNDRIDVYNKVPKQIFETFYVIMNNLNLKNTILRSIDMNLQVYGQDGTSHKDQFYTDMHNKDITILFYPHYKWQKTLGGQLQIMDGDSVYEEYFPIPGRVICFDSSVPHRALAPKVKNVGRFSIAYRLSQTRY